MDKPLISICVPIYNVEKFIERCVRSLFEQTYDNIEFIFVNDCTPDNSIDILERVINDYPKRKHQVRIIHHKKNRGIAAARNTLVDAAQGEFIMYVDSDDWVELNATDKLLLKQKETDADIVSGKAIAHKVEKDEIFQDPFSSDKEDLICQMMEANSNRVIWRRLIRTSLYKDNDIRCVEGLNIGEDGCILPKIIYYANKLEWIDDIIYHYNRFNDKSITIVSDNNKKKIEELKSNLAVTDVLCEFFGNKSKKYEDKIMQVRTAILIRICNGALTHKDKQTYDLAVKKLNKIGSYYLDKVHWGTKKTRWIYQHYYLIQLYTLLKFRFE